MANKSGISEEHAVHRLREKRLMDAAIDVLDAAIILIHELEAHDDLSLDPSARRALRDLKRNVSSCEYEFAHLQIGHGQ